MVLQRISFDVLWHIVYFPLWWYSGGVKHAGLFCYHVFQMGNEMLAPGLWVRNIFVPMYGQTDWQGRLMSFFMRLVNIIFRGTILFVWLLFAVVLFLLWILFPVALIYMLGKAL